MEELNKYQKSRRVIRYISTRILVIGLIIMLGLVIMLTMLNISNLYIISSEGLALRAECILKNGDRAKLAEYFTEDFIKNDSKLYDGKYSNFTINSYDYAIDVKNINVWPWQSVASMHVIERMKSMKGNVNPSAISEGETSASYPLPEWETAEYIVTFRKIDDKWFISGYSFVTNDIEEQPKHTPDMSLIETEQP